MKFLTYFTEILQTPEPNYWITKHNQLFKDENGAIYLVPRFFITDGYTIPDWIVWLAGGRMKYDIRAAIEHDLECRFHKCIKVLLTEKELVEMGFLRTHKKVLGNETFYITVCDDIPVRYLSIEHTTFNQTNSRFKRMMLATGLIKKWRAAMLRFGVNFNYKWFIEGCKDLDLYKLYKGVI